MATTWLITREAEDAQPERDAWISRGANAILVPCVETKLLPWPWSTSAQFTFFTSRRSVAAWVAGNRPPLKDVAAMSPATANALEREGIRATVTCENGARALAEKLREWWNGHGRPPLTISYPTSDAGLQAAEQTEALEVLSQLGSVERRVAYTVSSPLHLRQSLERAAKGDWSISFASPSAVHHFFTAHALIEKPPSQVACLGASTERAWNVARPESWPHAINSRTFPHTEKVEP